MERTRGVKNHLIKYENYYEMSMINKNKHKKCYFDIADHDLVTQHIWKIDKQGYIYTMINSEKGNKRRITMHRLILGVLDESCLVDHQDLEKNNNRRGNLRKANKSKNEMNKPLTSLNHSGVRGVSYRKTRDTWASEIRSESNDAFTRIRKSFPLFDDAVKYRLINESNLFKEFSPNYNKLTNTIQLTYMSHDDNVQTFIEVDISGNILNFNKLE